MYNILKSIAKKIVPKKVLIDQEENFRRILLPLYKGNSHECNVCDTKLKRFAQLPNDELICPVCGSLPRARRLYMMLEKEFLKPGLSVLDFSPFRTLYRKLKKRKDFDYYPSDFEDDFLSDYQYDMTDIATGDKTFDLIICYHILEHIDEDRQAMRELYRVLMQGGKVLIQTPFKEGEIYEDRSITTPEQREKYFGQDNHVRIYSVSGLETRLKEAGFKTEIRKLKGDDYFGFSENEIIIICEK